MKLELSPKIQKLIQAQVRCGKYPTANDVVAAALTNLEQQHRIASLSKTDLAKIYPNIRAKLAVGLAAARAGRLSDGDEFFDELEKLEKKPASKPRKSA
jgi:Arc/MetJ-type ribon-helix-helix transcriptional regulator